MKVFECDGYYMPGGFIVFDSFVEKELFGILIYTKGWLSGSLGKDE